jgi:cytochrome c oxidase subunit 2
MVVLMRTALALALLLIAAPVSFTQDQPPAPPAAQVVDVTAERFSFTPSEIKTVVGTTLEIRLRSEDTNHGFRIIGTDVNVEIPKRSRGTTTVTFTPDRVGRYTWECSHLCGAGHSFMRGEIVVQDRAATAR